MDRMVYIAMVGAANTLQAQQVNNNNLANADTTGFRADLDSFLPAPVSGPGYASRAYSEEAGVGFDAAPGPIEDTGRSLDVAIRGPGWIAVQAPDGTEAYTRRGDLQISSTGMLETGTGNPVLGNGGPIVIPPAQKVSIGGDGTISIVPLGQGANTLAVLDRIKLVNPPAGQLEKGSDGLFRLTSGGTAPADASVSVQSGALEGSNVNSIDALVKMISNARQFEAYVKLMNAAKQNDQASATLLQKGG